MGLNSFNRFFHKLQLHLLHLAKFVCLITVSLFLFSLAPSTVLGQEGEEEVLTLDQILTQVLKENRLLEASLLEVEKAEKRESAFKTNRYPQIKLRLLGVHTLTTVESRFEQGTLGQITLPPMGGPPVTIPIPPQTSIITTDPQFNTLFLGTVVQPISQLYRLNLGVNLHELNSKMMKEKHAAQRQTIVNNVKKLYFGILQVQSGLDASRESLRFIKELSRTVDEYVKQQTALKAEGMEVKALLAKEEYTELTLQNNLLTLKEQMNNLLRRDIRIPFRINPLPQGPSVEMELEAAQDFALQNRPELKEARLKVEAAETDRRIKKAEYIPDLSAMFGYIALSDIIGIIPRNVAVAGLYFTWDPFDWGKKSKELAEKSKTVIQAKNQLQETEAQILMDVNSHFRKMGEAKKLVSVAETARDAARERLKVTTDSYSEERGLLKDVLQAESTLAEKSNLYQQALLSYWTAVADFEKAIGEE